MYISLEKQMIPYSIKQKGRALFKENAMTAFRVPEDSSIYKTMFIDHETVKDDNNGNYHCSCQTFAEKQYCEHVYAVSLQIEEENQQKNKINFKNRILQQEAATLLSLFQEKLSAHYDSGASQKKKLHVGYFLRLKIEEDGTSLSLEIKVGTERDYVVKNISNFVTAVDKQQLVSFNKNFTYDPNEYYFSEKDQQILQHLFQISKVAEMYDTDTIYWSKSYEEEKQLIIPPTFATELLQLLGGQDASLTVMRDKEALFKYNRIALETTKPDFTFKLNKDSEAHYILEMEDVQQSIFLESYRLLFLDGTFYALSTEDWQALQPFISFQHITKNEIVQFSEQQLSEVISYVLPSLQKSGELEIDTAIQDRLVKRPLEIEVHVQKVERQHTVDIAYHYGEQSFHPFQIEEQLENQAAIIIRDVEKETHFMQIIENAPLHISSNQLVVDDKEASYYQFYARTVPALSALADVYLDEELETLVEKDVLPTTTLDVSTELNYLSIAFDFKGIDPAEVPDILNAIREHKKYYRLENGHFISLEEERFKQMERILTLIDIRKKDLTTEVHVPLYRGLQIYDTIASTPNENRKFTRSFRHLIEDITAFQEEIFTLPSNIQAELRDYQIVGFEWMKSLAKYQLGGILADDMGLGKTLQTITFLASEIEGAEALDPILIVTPASLLYNWQNEFEKFAPALKVQIIDGNKQNRDAIIANLESNAVYLISYPSLRQDITSFQEHTFSSVILDESQAVKNYHTKTSQAVRALHRYQTFALSGTPLENNLDELWTIFQTLMPGFFPSLRKFKLLENDQIARMIRPFLLRRIKQDVLKELPDKIETNLYSELTEEQKVVYLAYLERIQTELAQDDETNRMKLLAGLTRLRQICCDPTLFVDGYQGGSGKLLQLLDTIQTARENGKRMLIFSQFTSMLGIIQSELNKIGMEYFYMDGQTPSKERVNLVNAFNEGGKDIFLISLKAGGTGLNLTGADTVILYDLWWNPAVEEQAASRAHRIGQKNVVQVIRMVAKGTIEERIFDLQKKKQALIDDIIQPGEKLLNTLSVDELKALLLENRKE